MLILNQRLSLKCLLIFLLGTAALITSCSEEEANSIFGFSHIEISEIQIFNREFDNTSGTFTFISDQMSFDQLGLNLDSLGQVIEMKTTDFAPIKTIACIEVLGQNELRITGLTDAGGPLDQILTFSTGTSNFLIIDQQETNITQRTDDITLSAYFLTVPSANASFPVCDFGNTTIERLEDILESKKFEFPLNSIAADTQILICKFNYVYSSK